jgi:lipoprotein NlpD
VPVAIAGAAEPQPIAGQDPAPEKPVEPVPKGTRSTAMPSQELGPVIAGSPRWRWPTVGQVKPAGGHGGQQGLEILGELGQPVVSASDGKVVYSGSGLMGYGKLIIVKHNDDFLSAYAHNDKLLVSQGTTVRAGQQIAEMGQSGSKTPTLHFEIRRKGRSVSPLEFLPKR